MSNLQPPIVSQIVAISKNRIIGASGQLPWHIPEDLKYFREKTKGRICIMGRKTFDSIGRKPLPHRLNMVVSRSEPENLPADGRPSTGKLMFFKDANAALDEALSLYRANPNEWGSEIFVVGGGEIYRQLMPRSDRLYVTEIDKEVTGDASYPEVDSNKYKEVSRIQKTDPLHYAFVIYEKF